MPNDTAPPTPSPATPPRSPNSTRILRELEGSDVDVDHLAERVARAAELIQLCRDEDLRRAAAHREVIADLDAVVGADPSPIDRRTRRHGRDE